jgi:hypothetical protein
MAMIRRSRDRGEVSGHSELVRRALRTERQLKGYRPETPPWTGEPPPAPKHADEVLAAISERYPPGTCIGLAQVLEVIDISWEEARAVRDWATAVGAWPWLKPGGYRRPGRPDRLRGPCRKGGRSS